MERKIYPFIPSSLFPKQAAYKGFWLFLKIDFFLYVHGYFAYYRYMHHQVWAVPSDTEESIRCPGSRVIESCELPCGYWVQLEGVFCKRTKCPQSLSPILALFVFSNKCHNGLCYQGGYWKLFVIMTECKTKVERTLDLYWTMCCLDTI